MSYSSASACIIQVDIPGVASKNANLASGALPVACGIVSAALVLHAE
jgi:hypothetical protein